MREKFHIVSGTVQFHFVSGTVDSFNLLVGEWKVYFSVSGIVDSLIFGQWDNGQFLCLSVEFHLLVGQ